MQVLNLNIMSSAYRMCVWRLRTKMLLSDPNITVVLKKSKTQPDNNNDNYDNN